LTIDDPIALMTRHLVELPEQSRDRMIVRIHDSLWRK